MVLPVFTDPSAYCTTMARIERSREKLERLRNHRPLEITRVAGCDSGRKPP